MEIIEVAEKISATFRDESEWLKFGLRLLNTTDKTELSKIQHKYPDKGKILSKCMDLLDLWKKTNSNPEWKQVIQALREVNLLNLAMELEKAFKPKQPDGTNRIDLGKHHTYQVSKQDSEQGKQKTCTLHFFHGTTTKAYFTNCNQL